MIRFEVSTLADAMKKAFRVAPVPKSVNESYGAGVHIVFDEQSNTVLLSATDGEVFYRQIVNALEITGSGEWRVSKAAGMFIQSLPFGSGSEVVMSQENNIIQMVRHHGRGKTLGTVPLMGSHDFPRWQPFDETGAEPISAFASRIEAVAWAAASPEQEPTHPELCGVYLDGTHVWATNRRVAARMPLEVPFLVDEPVTVPAKVMTGVTHHAGDVLVLRTELGLGIAPDEFTQIGVRVYGKNLHPHLKLKTDFSDTCRFERDHFKDAVARMFHVVKPDKGSKLRIVMGNNKIVFTMTGPIRENRVEDYIEAETSNDIPVAESYNPNYIHDAVSKAAGDHVTIHYNTDASKQFTYITSGAGYESWVAPLSSTENMP